MFLNLHSMKAILLRKLQFTFENNLQQIFVNKLQNWIRMKSQNQKALIYLNDVSVV